MDISEKAQAYVKSIFNHGIQKENKSRIVSEIKTKMQIEVDQFGKPLFKPEEFLNAVQIKCLISNFEQENKTIECNICKKQFSKQSNLSYHFKMQHAQHRNKITSKAKTYVKGKIFIELCNGVV